MPVQGARERDGGAVVGLLAADVQQLARRRRWSRRSGGSRRAAPRGRRRRSARRRRAAGPRGWPLKPWAMTTHGTGPAAPVGTVEPRGARVLAAGEGQVLAFAHRSTLAPQQQRRPTRRRGGARSRAGRGAANARGDLVGLVRRAARWRRARRARRRRSRRRRRAAAAGAAGWRGRSARRARARRAAGRGGAPRTATPLAARVVERGLRRDSRSWSTPSTGAQPSRAAAIASTPEPQPRSTQRAAGLGARAAARGTGASSGARPCRTPARGRSRRRRSARRAARVPRRAHAQRPPTCDRAGGRRASARPSRRRPRW